MELGTQMIVAIAVATEAWGRSFWLSMLEVIPGWPIIQTHAHTEKLILLNQIARKLQYFVRI